MQIPFVDVLNLVETRYQSKIMLFRLSLLPPLLRLLLCITFLYKASGTCQAIVWVFSDVFYQEISLFLSLMVPVICVQACFV